MFRVLASGPQALFQDAGRSGYMSSGVSPSGAFDRASAVQANRVVGNAPGATVVEILFGGFSVEALAAATVVFTGTNALVHVELPNGYQYIEYTHTIIDVQPGTRLTLDSAQQGLRTYFAVRGGFAAPQVLGSASTDMLSAIGPDQLRVGDTLVVGTDVSGPGWYSWVRDCAPVRAMTNTVTLGVIPGPREEWFTAESVERFYSEPFEVSSESNRIGIRVHGEQPLERALAGEIASEGMVRGSIQVPPSGFPVLFGVDHPVTGGYPVIGVLDWCSSDCTAQLRPGDIVRFQRVVAE